MNMQMQQRSMEASSDASYYDREPYEDWGSRSSHSLQEEVTTQSSGHHDATTLRCERDALARALSAERARAAAAARAHDARLAELHGVIAELVRRRAADKQARAIPEEEVSDECESTTQPAGELDNDADRSRTDQNDSSSITSPAELPTPQEPKLEPESETFKHEVQVRIEKPQEMSSSETHPVDNCDTSLDLSARDSEVCLSTARCCGYAVAQASTGSCSREHGSADDARRASPHHPRRARLVRLRRAEHEREHSSNDETWCAEAAERLALDVCAQADLREALVTASNDGCALSASLAAWRARCARLQADTRVLACALARAADTAHRLSCACAVQESSSVSVCLALRAADRALEAYDVLLALAETAGPPPPADERKAAEMVAKQLLARLDAEHTSATIGEPLLSPGPWLQHDGQAPTESEWTEACESRLRAHAARLKSDTVTLRNKGQAPALFSYHDVEEDELPKSMGSASMAEMEAAVMMQEVLSAREARAAARAARLGAPLRDDHHDQHDQHDHHDDQNAHKDQADRDDYNEHQDFNQKNHTQQKQETSRSRRRRERHWLDTRASETDL